MQATLLRAVFSAVQPAISLAGMAALGRLARCVSTLLLPALLQTPAAAARRGMMARTIAYA